MEMEATGERTEGGVKNQGDLGKKLYLSLTAFPGWLVGGEERERERERERQRDRETEMPRQGRSRLCVNLHLEEVLD